MKAILYFLLLIVFLYSCTKDSGHTVYSRPEGCDSVLFSYTTHIAPILQVNCNLPACHAAGGEGSYDLTSYAVVADRIRTGRFVQRLFLPVDDPLHMPPDINMNPCEKYKLVSWVMQGYPDN